MVTNSAGSNRVVKAAQTLPDTGRQSGPTIPVRSVSHLRLLPFLLAAICVTAALAVPSIHAQAREPIAATYPENGEAPVLVLASTDPEGMGVHWEVTGLDSDDFSISQQGVLTFKDPPDFESPTDREMLDDTNQALVVEEGLDNEYHLVVHAIEVREEGATRRALSSSRNVVVVVRNVDEPGTVVLNRLRPEVGTPLTAMLIDGAGIEEGVIWRWYTSKVIDPDPSDNNHWSLVGDADSGTYTPRGDRVDGVVSDDADPDAPLDEGRFLRAVAAYTDGNGSLKTATGMSAHRVRAEVSSHLDLGFSGNPANGSPGFHPDRDYDLSVLENSPVGTPVGHPIVAIDPNDDVLTYELDDSRSSDDQLDTSGDMRLFSIDMATGQIRVAVEGLNYEDMVGRPYRFFVRAIDPSGETAEVEVSVSLIDGNDPPVIGEVTTGGLPPRSLWVNERTDEGADTPLNDRALLIFSATDEDVRDQVFIRLDGEDRSAFILADVIVEGQGGLLALLFADPPDHEKPADRYGSNIYRVTLVATDSDGADARLPLTVLVDNVPESGSVITRAEGTQPLQPRVGEWVHADLSDADGDIAAVTWQWSRVDYDTEGTRFEIIPGATGRSYMPTEEDGGHYLRVTATYIDSTSDSDDPHTTNIDERVQRLEGAIVTAKTAGDLDAPDRLYRVTSTSVYSVRSAETDDDRTPAGFEHPSYDREVAENSETGTIVGAPVRVRSHSESTTYELQDQFPLDHFTIDRHGQIRVGAVPVPTGTTYLPTTSPVATTTDPDLDHEGIGSYILTVRAAGDGDDVSATRVNVTLKDVNEPPHFTRSTLEDVSTPLTFPERIRNLTVARLSAVEPDGDGLSWELIGPDAGSFMLDGGRLAFRERRDFERPGSAAGTNAYVLNVVVTELSAVGGGPLRSAELPITVEVTNSNDPGTIDFSLLQPEVDTALTARLRDIDGSVSGTEWTWYIARVSIPGPVTGTEPSDLAGEWSLIAGATGEAYTPVGTDEGRHLLAVVTYTDALGTGNVAHAMTAHTVRPDVSDDANNAPGFGVAEITIVVPESLSVGEPVGRPIVVAMKADDEVLTYDLDDDFDRETDPDMDGDMGFFTIDRASGQLYLGKNLSHEATDGRDYSDSDSPLTAGVYTMVVRATDPSGESDGGDSDSVVVKVVATDVNDPPMIQSGMSELSVYEVDRSSEDTDGARYVGLGYLLEDGATSPTLDPASPNLYRVSDEDPLDTRTWPEPIAGPDGDLFEYSSAVTAQGRRIHFRSPPDYEAPQDSDGDNVYEITLRVVDGSGAVAERDVRIRVLNVNEGGSLSITPDQPVAESPAVARLTDPDGIIAITDWRWATSSHRVSRFPEGSVVEGASTGSHAGTAGEFLWVMVKYRDGASVEDSVVTLVDERNDDPSTPKESAVETDYDSDEVLSEGSGNAVQTGRSTGTAAVGPTVTIDLQVAENTPGTGYAGLPMAGLGVRKTAGELDNGMFVFAEDHDAIGDGYYDDTLAPVVDEDDKMDQLALKPGNHLDFEGAGGTYVLELQAPGGGDVDPVTLIVNITVTDVNEPPSIPRRSRAPSPATAVSPTRNPVFDTSTTTRYIAENTLPGVYVGDPVVATHPDPDELLSYSLGGEDADHFDIATSTGQLLTKEPLDHETENTYTIDVEASDATGATAAISVTVVVTNVGLDTRYDADDSGTIDRDEIVWAISDYFAGGPEAPDGEEILELISIYLSG